MGICAAGNPQNNTAVRAVGSGLMGVFSDPSLGESASQTAVGPSTQTEHPHLWLFTEGTQGGGNTSLVGWKAPLALLAK